MTYKRRKRNKRAAMVDPDEIFLDSKNIANFDRQQFEGRIEKPISKKTILFLGIFFVVVVGAFSTRLGYLQIQKGEAYYKRSENNILEKVILFAERGIIYDRNKVELAWNKKADSPKTEDTEQKKEEVFGIREYLSPGFSHLLGYVSYPAKDKSGNYWQGEFKGLDGLEKQYDSTLKGQNGSKIVEIDAHNTVHGENIVNAPKRGKDMVITIDSKVQKELFRLIKNAAVANSFTGGAGVIMDVENGEILVDTSYPEYDSSVLSLGKDSKTIKSYLGDKRKVFMDRTISGLYTPGSIIKPIFAIGALAENIISSNKKILSTGSISIPNPYLKDQKTVFKDWKAHGWTDMGQAIAVSSDVYFYTIGGGFEDQKGLGIVNLEKYSKLFGIGEKTGVDLPDEKSGNIPNPEWKLKNFAGDQWRIGDTYHTAIGQYGFQVTPMEIVRAIGALANEGTLVTPHLIQGDLEKEKIQKVVDLNKEYYEIIHDGMRQAVTYGTAVALNVPYVKVAAKTGTAQLGLSKNKVNSWVVGFFPYEKPKYAFAILMESGPASGSVGASSIMRGLLDYMSIYTPEYFK
jgi:penicillin-binding protein 2